MNSKLFYVPRMMLQNFLPEMALVDMHVDFGGTDVLVSQHSLYGTQVCTTLQELCRKAMAEGVRANVLANACLLGIILDIDKERDAAQVLSSTQRDKDIVFLARLDGNALPFDEPIPQSLYGSITNGY